MFCEKFTKKHIDKIFKKPAASTPANVSNSAHKTVKTKERAAPLQNAPIATNSTPTEISKEDKKEYFNHLQN